MEVPMIKRIALVLLACMILSGGLLAQQTKSRIIGTVTDSEGSFLPGVAVTAVNPKMVGRAETITDENGVYRLLNLTPGVFRIEYSLEGFQSVVRENIRLTLEQTLNLDVSLSLGKLEERIEVSGKVPLIDVKNTSKGMTLTRELFTTLPKGRNFDSLMSTIPGVHQEQLPENDTRLRPNDASGRVGYSGGTSVDGASGAENMYFIDGVNTTGLQSGRAGLQTSFEFIDEVQVKASGYQAEFGGSLGGVVNVVTRAGGNRFSGELIGYYSGSALQGKERDTLRLNPENLDVAEYVNYQDLYGKDTINRIEAGFALGGYIFKDRLWFFGSFLPVFKNTERTVEFLSGDISEGTYERKENYWNYSFKLTSQPIKNLRLSASFANNLYKWRGDLPSRAGTSNSAKDWDGSGFDYPGYNVSASMDYTIGNNLMVSLRGGYYFTNKTNQLVKPSGTRHAFWEEAQYSATTNIGLLDVPESLWRPAGWSTYGYADGLETVKDEENRLSFNIDFNYFVNLLGEHSWKIGYQFVRREHDIAEGYTFPYVMLAWDLAADVYHTGDYRRGKYGTYAVRSGESGMHGTVGNPVANTMAFYIQDSWTIGQKLTLNLGVRMEKEDIPSYIEGVDAPIAFDFFDKVAPRLGFVYDVNGDSSFKIFGSFGIFYDVMKLNLAMGAFGGDKWVSDYYTLDTYEWDKIGVDGYFPGEYLGSFNYRPVDFSKVNPDVKPMSQREISFGAEKKVAENISLSVRVVNKHLIRTIEDVGVLVPGFGEQYFYDNPGFGYTLPVSEGGKFEDIYPRTPKAQRDYWGVTVSVDKRLSNNWMGGASYTWSRLEGNYSGLASADEFGRVSPNTNRYFDTWFLAYDQDMEPTIGLLPTDRTHYFKAYGSYTFDFGLTVGSVINLYSGVPTSTEFAMNNYQGFYPVGRADMGRTPFMALADLYAQYQLRLSDQIRVELSVNIDNLFDTATAERIFSTVNLYDVSVTDAQLLSGNFDYRNTGFTPDKRFGMETWFHAPISVRFGMKLFF
jgi:hypothetical protein